MYPVVVIDGIETHQAFDDPLHPGESEHGAYGRGVRVDLSERGTAVGLGSQQVERTGRLELGDGRLVDLLGNHRFEGEEPLGDELRHLGRGEQIGPFRCDGHSRNGSQLASRWLGRLVAKGATWPFRVECWDLGPWAVLLTVTMLVGGAPRFAEAGGGTRSVRTRSGGC